MFTAPDSTIECQILDSSYIATCSRIMAEAYIDSPVYVYIFQDFPISEQRKNCLEWLFQRNLRMIFRKTDSALRGILKDDTVIACFLWMPSEFQEASFSDMMTVGLWEIPFRFGYKTMKRLLHVMDEMKDDLTEMRGRFASDEPYIMLERMVVRPEYQGQKWGSRVLQTTFESMKKPREVWLTTQLERNVTFYSRLGFETASVQNHFESDSEYSYRNWVLYRK